MIDDQTYLYNLEQGNLKLEEKVGDLEDEVKKLKEQVEKLEGRLYAKDNLLDDIESMADRAQAL